MKEGKKLSIDLAEEYSDLLTRTIDLLARLRKLAYEDMNQFQHEYRCLQMAALLRRQVPGGVRLRWHWHPAQTNHPREADVVGYASKTPMVQAEVTTSPRPIGNIDQNMGKKLKHLVALPGRYKFYGVVSKSMQIRAETKAKPLGIYVVLLSDPPRVKDKEH